MLTPIYIDSGVLMGAIMAAGSKQRIEARSTLLFTGYPRTFCRRERTSIYSHLNNLFTKGLPL